jgi:hypothetical protein
MKDDEDLERMRRFGAYEEREQIISELSLHKANLAAMGDRYPVSSANMDIRIKTIETIIAIIKGR